jgi:hydroxymethylbilane synthase
MVMLRLGSRGSLLALWQARHIRDRLMQDDAGLTVEIVILHTTGDRITDVPLAMIGDRGLFTKEIDRAVVDAEVDFAVHSLKDVPTRLADGLALGAITVREDPRDVVVPAPDILRLATGDEGRARAVDAAPLDALPRGARVGTSSLRRRSQLLHLRPDLDVQDLRGNLDTRLARVTEGRFDAILLAAAGLRRLGRPEAAWPLDPPAWLPAVGQGALAIAARAGDERTLGILARLDHRDTHLAVAAERAFLGALEGGCQIPIGGLATVIGERLRLHGFVGSLDGRRLLRHDEAGDVAASAPGAEAAAAAAAIGRRLAERMRASGAGEILAEIRGVDPRELPRSSPP